MWDQRYGEAGFAYGTEPNDFLVEQAGLIPRGKVLCLAEGEGRNAVYLATLGHEVTAVDASSVGLEKAARLAKERGVELKTQVADLANYHIEPLSYTSVVSIWCHVPPAVRVPLHRAVVDALLPGGLLVLEAYTPRQLEYKTGGPPVVELTMTLEALRIELAGLDFLQGVERERVIHEGKYHDGPSHVVQVVAQKPLTD